MTKTTPLLHHQYQQQLKEMTKTLGKHWNALFFVETMKRSYNLREQHWQIIPATKDLHITNDEQNKSLLLHHTCINPLSFSIIPCNTKQYQAIPCNTKQYRAILFSSTFYCYTFFSARLCHQLTGPQQCLCESDLKKHLFTLCLFFRSIEYYIYILRIMYTATFLCRIYIIYSILLAHSIMMIIAIMTRRMTVSFGVNELNHKYSDEERMLMTMTMGLMMFMAMMTRRRMTTMTRRCRTVPFGVNRLNRECSSYTSVSNSLWILSAFSYTMQKKKSWLNVLDILKWT